MLKLTLEKRDPKSNNEVLREEGKTPAVFYGQKTESTPVTMSFGDFLSIWQEAGESTIIKLETPDGDKNALIQDVQVHPVTGDPLHADFYVVEKGQKLTVDVPLEFIGEAEVEKSGGVVVKVIHEIEVESEPQDLPSEIEVDISGLKEVGDHILVSDLNLPPGVETTLEPDEIVVSTTEAREEEEPEEEEDTEIDFDAIEVEGERPEEDEEGEGGGDEAAPPASDENEE